MGKKHVIYEAVHSHQLSSQYVLTYRLELFAEEPGQPSLRGLQADSYGWMHMGGLYPQI